MKIKRLFLLAGLFYGSALCAQQTTTFYDLDTIQKIEVFFTRTDWKTALDSAKSAGNGDYIVADSVRVNGSVYDSCGVKFKGNSSYSSEYVKNPFNISLDEYKSHNYQGVKTIKLANEFRDPSMIRDVLGYKILSNYMHCSRANFAELYINNEYIGVYSNTEAVNKLFCRNHYGSSSNTFFEGTPSGDPQPANKASLRYIDDDSASYEKFYELKSEIGWNKMITMFENVTNQTDSVPYLVDVDKFLWMMAFDNVFVNLDSYIGAYCQNYFMYEDENGRFNPIVWDLNLAFGTFPYAGSGAKSTGAMTDENKVKFPLNIHSKDSYWPMIKYVFANETYIKSYYAHVKTIANEAISSGLYETLADSIFAIAKESVYADTNKFYTNDDFDNGLTTSIAACTDYNAPGVKSFCVSRNEYLQSTDEFNYTQPTISSVVADNISPDLGDEITFVATVSDASLVELRYRKNNVDMFTSVQMTANGDGTYTAKATIESAMMEYYVYAENENIAAFSPARAEFEFYTINVNNVETPEVGDIVINEFMVKNKKIVVSDYGEFSDWIELYNNSEKILNVSDLYLSNTEEDLQLDQLTKNVVMLPNTYLMIWCDGKASTSLYNHTSFKLSQGGKIYLANGSNVIYDSVSYDTINKNVSCARIPNGTGSFVLSKATFGYDNTLQSQTSTAITFLEKSSSIIVYPCPAIDYVIISTEKENPVICKIYNTQGLLVSQAVFEKQITIQTTNWKPGMYYAIIDGETKAFVKE